MKNTLLRKRILMTAIAGLALGLTLRAAEGDVVPSLVRANIIGHAKTLLSPKENAAAPRDPFHSEAFEQALATISGRGVPQAPTETTRAAVAGPRTGRDILQSIAANLKPSGYFVLGGEPTLVFGQKRVKAGGFLTITFEGNEYTLEIASIERPNFTLRLNREEFTRPIK